MNLGLKHFEQEFKSVLNCLDQKKKNIKQKWKNRRKKTELYKSYNHSCLLVLIVINLNILMDTVW